MSNNKKGIKDFLSVIIIMSVIAAVLFAILLFSEVSVNSDIIDDGKGSLLGGLVGAIATIIVFKITTNESKRQFDIIEKRNTELTKRQNRLEEYQIEKERIDKLPWLSLNMDIHTKKCPFKECRSIYVLFENFPIKQESRSLVYFNAPAPGWGFNNSANIPNIVLEYHLKNVGSDSALNINCAINNNYIDEFDLCKQEELYIFLCINDISSIDTEELTMCFEFLDITHTHLYSQQNQISVLKIKKEASLMYKENKRRLSNPKRIHSRTFDYNSV